MLKAKHLNKIAKSQSREDKTKADIIEKEILMAAMAGKYNVEVDSDLFDSDIREKLTQKGFTLYYGDVTTCISWGNI